MDTKAPRFEVFVARQGDVEAKFYCSVASEAQAEAVIRDEILPAAAFRGQPAPQCAIFRNGRCLDDFAREAQGVTTDPEDLRSFLQA